MLRQALVAALWAGFLGPTVAQDMCNWKQVRAATARDAVYLDGGALYRQASTSSGNKAIEPDNGINGFIYYLNFSLPFDTTSTNLTSLFQTLQKAAGAGNNIAPNYRDGVLFSNDNTLFLYGGVLRATQSQTPPDDDEILSYELRQYGQDSPTWQPAPYQVDLDNDVTRYITNGAGVSVPSENVGFYISGTHSEDWGPVLDNGRSNITSDKMITVDMSTMRQSKWTNRTLPDYVKGRANAEAVWLPVADAGIVVLIGGVSDSATISRDLSDSQKEDSERTSPGFMDTVAVYDISGDKWYLQNTTGEVPPQLTEFCSVYATANDSSSHNIYIYGGYDGLDTANTKSDDVYVLSVPSFEWVKLYEGDRAHGRSGHKCVKPYPDQMFVLGGAKISLSECVEGGIVQVFNLNTGRFQDKYDPTDWNHYAVPDMITGKIGGDAKGGATKTSPSSWTNSSLEDVFKSSYTKTVPTWYPYEPATTTNAPTISPIADKGSSFPGWAGAIIGVVLGVALIAGAFLFWCLRRRRKHHASQPKSEISERRSRIMGWVLGVPKSGETTVSADDTAFDDDAKTQTNTTSELPSQPVHEMADPSTSPPVELPTAYNNLPLPSPSASSTAASHSGYVSPISPSTPEPGAHPGDNRPGHHRHVSSVSSSHSASMAQVIYEETVTHDSSQRPGPHPHRPSYASGVSDVSASSEGARPKGVDTSGLGTIAD